MVEDAVAEKINHVVNIIRQSRYTVAFSGAGMSTDSGIPDFRSPDSGLWHNVDPMNVASIFGFKRNPKAFYDWVRPLTKLTVSAQPNPAHYALVDLERLGLLRSVITQNIDMLHTRAGNTCVYELHGHMRQATCIHCFAVYDGEPILHQFLQDGLVPLCPNCNGPIKPNVVLFGEQLPVREFQAAQEAARRCDLMLVIGSSLEVAPAGDLPMIAKRSGAKIVIVNLEPTPADRLAEVVIHARAAEVMPLIVSQLEKLI